MPLNLKDKFGIWLDDVKDKIYNVFGRDKSEKEDNLYETRWVWYHTALVVELLIIIILLVFLAIWKNHKNSKGTNAKKAIINFYNDGDMDSC